VPDSCIVILFAGRAAAEEDRCAKVCFGFMIDSGRGSIRIQSVLTGLHRYVLRRESDFGLGHGPLL